MTLLLSHKQAHPHEKMLTEPPLVSNSLAEFGKQKIGQVKGQTNGHSHNTQAQHHDKPAEIKVQSDSEIWEKAHAHLIDTGVPWVPILIRKAKGCLLYVSVFCFRLYDYINS